VLGIVNVSLHHDTVGVGQRGDVAQQILEIIQVTESLAGSGD